VQAGAGHQPLVLLVDAQAKRVARGAHQVELASKVRGLDGAPLAVGQVGVVARGAQAARPRKRPSAANPNACPNAIGISERRRRRRCRRGDRCRHRHRTL